MTRSLRAARTVLLAAGLLVTGGTTGCLFTVEHQLPPDAYFGRRPDPGAHATRQPFRDAHMKNWALAGLVPYSGWSSGDMLGGEAKRRNVRVEDLAIETRFGTLDTIVWVVPGFAYGYYLWAPRTVEVSGTRVTEAERAR